MNNELQKEITAIIFAVASVTMAGLMVMVMAPAKADTSNTIRSNFNNLSFEQKLNTLHSLNWLEKYYKVPSDTEAKTIRGNMMRKLLSGDTQAAVNSLGSFMKLGQAKTIDRSQKGQHIETVYSNLSKPSDTAIIKPVTPSAFEQQHYPDYKAALSDKLSTFKQYTESQTPSLQGKMFDMIQNQIQSEQQRFK